MTEWETYQYPDESLPRSFTMYKGIQCLCFPSEKESGCFDVEVFTSKGNWQKGPYQLIRIMDTWSEENSRNIRTLEESQTLCIETVERYLRGEIKPIYTERKYDPGKKVKAGESSGTTVRRKRRKKRSR